MATRRDAREWAVQMLFGMDFNPRDNLDELIADFWKTQDDAPGGKMRAFAESLFRGVVEHRAEIDEKIRDYAENWDVARMGRVDLSVLRLGMLELFFVDDVPPVVVMNEAVDLAKYFSSSESGRFVNGIMDRASKDVERDPRG